MSFYLPYHHRLLRNFQHPKAHLPITNLKIQNPEFSSVNLQKIIKKLQATKLLQKLTLDLKKIQLDQGSTNSIYLNLIKELRNIKTLEIILSPDSIFENQSLEFLLKALKTFRGLKTLTVAIPTQFEEVPPKYVISDFINALRKSAPRLQQAKFFLIDEIDGSSSGLPILKEWKISQLGNLQKLALHLPKSVFIDQEKLDLSSLKRIKRLKSLDITLSKLHTGPQRALSEELAFAPNEIFPNLKHLKWGVQSDYVKKNTSIELLGCEIASQLKSLEDFGMIFQQNGELANCGIKETLQILSSLKTDLNKLSVAFSHNELTPNNADALIDALAGSRLQNMHTLCLKFHGCKGINGVFIDRLAQTISQNMKKLKFLRLSFECAQSQSRSFTGPLTAFAGLADHEINRLGVILSEGCGNLELISLKFWRYSHISDKGVMSLCSSLSQIKSLKTARFQFKFCPKVGSVSVKHAKEKFGPQRDVKLTTI